MTGRRTCDEAGLFQLEAFSELEVVVVLVVVVVREALPVLAVGATVLLVAGVPADASLRPSLGLVAMSQYLLAMIDTCVWSN